jgi:hypothetical protein
MNNQWVSSKKVYMHESSIRLGHAHCILRLAFVHLLNHPFLSSHACFPECLEDLAETADTADTPETAPETAPETPETAPGRSVTISVMGGSGFGSGVMVTCKYDELREAVMERVIESVGRVTSLGRRDRTARDRTAARTY